MAVQSAHEAFDLSLGHGRLDGRAGGNVGTASSSQEKATPLSWQGSASARNHQSPFCWARAVLSGELENAAKGVVPANTAASTQWAVKIFESWARSRPSSSTDAVPSDLLMSHDADLVSKWLCRFVLETRKTDGTRYPPATLRSLVSGLNRELQRNKAPFSVLDNSDARFRDLDSISPLKASQELSVVVHFTFPTTDLCHSLH